MLIDDDDEDERERTIAAMQEAIQLRGYLVFGSSVPQKIGQVHHGGVFEATLAKGQKFYVLGPTNEEDMKPQAEIYARHGLGVNTSGFDYYSRVNTD
jgi:hypothetical protein